MEIEEEKEQKMNELDKKFQEKSKKNGRKKRK